MRGEFNNIYVAFIILFLIIVFGTVGFMLIDQYSIVEAFFMTIITMSTVGYQEVRPLSENGMLFTSFLIIISFGVFAYFISTITKYVMDGEFKEYFKNYTVVKRIKNIKNHVIVCGFGRNGRQATIDLLLHNEKVVVIEKNDGTFEDEINEEFLSRKDFLFIHGDAVHEEALIKAKIGNAKALITTLPSDADNLYVVLTAREMNEEMIIISRASDDHSDSKLKRAGATNVIMPDKVGGTRMAKLVAEPDIIEFIENLMIKSGHEVNIEEISCDKLASCLINKTIGELNIRQISGANLIGMKTIDKSYIFNPSPSISISLYDKLFVLGTNKQIENLKKILISGKIKK